MNALLNDLHSRLGKTYKCESLSRFLLALLLNDRLRLHFCCSFYILLAYLWYTDIVSTFWRLAIRLATWLRGQWSFTFGFIGIQMNSNTAGSPLIDQPLVTPERPSDTPPSIHRLQLAWGDPLPTTGAPRDHHSLRATQSTSPSGRPGLNHLLQWKPKHNLWRLTANYLHMLWPIVVCWQIRAPSL